MYFNVVVVVVVVDDLVPLFTKNKSIDMSTTCTLLDKYVVVMCSELLAAKQTVRFIRHHHHHYHNCHHN